MKTARGQNCVGGVEYPYPYPYPYPSVATSIFFLNSRSPALFLAPVWMRIEGQPVCDWRLGQRRRVVWVVPLLAPGYLFSFSAVRLRGRRGKMYMGVGSWYVWLVGGWVTGGIGCMYLWRGRGRGRLWCGVAIRGDRGRSVQRRGGICQLEGLGGRE